MTRCLACNSLLTRGEETCAQCGARALVKQTRLPQMISRAATLLFYLSLGMMLVSLFLPAGVSFIKGFLLTVALLFLRRSAQDWAEKSAARQ